MRRYRFRLETVLRVRRIQEEQARAALVVANHDVARAAAAVTARYEHLARMPRPDRPVQAGAFLAAQAALAGAARAVSEARHCHRRVADVADERRRSWQQTATRVSSLERLDERHRDEHGREVRRQEDREVDDLVVTRFRRREDR
ncbi:MAG: flagellar export protein FliJ [Acidimicrobiia bacterium]|nr:flagellar export protein FliJ [Acidimicrobiia bacterium]